MRWCDRPPASPSASSALSRSPSNAKKPRSSTSCERSPPPPGRIGSIAIRCAKKIKNEDTGQDEWVTDWIEGPSIKLANDTARIFGNNINEVREIDVGDAWTFYARFTDIETGFSMERAYRQRKGQTSVKSKDADRQLDIAYQIGQSKAIRNCIVNALQIYADFAFEEARNSLVDKIGKKLEDYRARTIEGIAKIPVELLRVERVIGRPAKDWLAPDIARVLAMMRAIADGMASADDSFPSLAAPAAEATPSRQARRIRQAFRRQAFRRQAFRRQDRQDFPFRRGRGRVG